MIAGSEMDAVQADGRPLLHKVGRRSSRGIPRPHRPSSGAANGDGQRRARLGMKHKPGAPPIVLPQAVKRMIPASWPAIENS